MVLTPAPGGPHAACVRDTRVTHPTCVVEPLHELLASLLDGAQRRLRPAGSGRASPVESCDACAGGWGARQRLTQLTQKHDPGPKTHSSHSKKAKVMELEPRGLKYNVPRVASHFLLNN